MARCARSTISTVPATARRSCGLGLVFHQLFAIQNDRHGAVLDLELILAPLVFLALAFNLVVLHDAAGGKGIGRVRDVDLVAIDGGVLRLERCAKEYAAIGGFGCFEFDNQFEVLPA